MTRRRGFTLIELSVALAIAGMLLALGMQGYGAWRRVAALQKAAGGLAALLTHARTQAGAWSTPYRLRYDPERRTLAGDRSQAAAGGGSSDWMQDRLLTLEAPAELLMPEGKPIWILDSGGAVLDAEGVPAASQTLTIEVRVAEAGGQESRRQVSLPPAGRVRVERP